MLKNIRYLKNTSLSLPGWLGIILALPVILFLGIFSVQFIQSQGPFHMPMILMAAFLAGLNLFNTMLTLVFRHYLKAAHMAILGTLAALSAFSQIYSVKIIIEPLNYQPPWASLATTIGLIFSVLFLAFIYILFKIHDKSPSASSTIYFIIFLYGNSIVALFGTIAVYGSIVSLALSLFYQAVASVYHFKVLWSSLKNQLSAILRLSKLQRAIITSKNAELNVIQEEGLMLHSILGNVSSKLVSENKLTTLLELIINEAGHSLGSDHIFLSLLERNSKLLWVAAYKSSFKPLDVPLDAKFLIHDYKAGKAIELYDLTEESPTIQPEFLQAGLKTMLGLPIMLDNILVGILEIYYKDATCLSASRKKLATYYASQIALSVKLFNQNDNLASLSSELNLLHETAKIASNQPSPNLYLLKTSKLLADFLGADGFAAYLARIHPTYPELEQIQLENFPSPDIARLKSWFFSTSLPTPQNQSALVTLTLSPAKTIQVMPLIIHQVFLGLIAFSWDYERETKISPLSENTLRTIASQIAMVLDRDRLYGSIQKIGLTDPLTSLANRRCFDFILNREINNLRRYKRPLSLLMIDIDFFKKINDTYGHQTGDTILKELGEVLRKFFRATDLPARYGGEEFAVILPESAAEPAAALAEELRAQIEKKIFDQTNRISLTVSIGTATLGTSKYVRQLPAGADLILAADQALYRAKQAGRNRVEITPE